MKIISLDSKICQDLDQALKKEWLEINQFGGFASSTIISANTRRHHGLLIAQLKSPLGRHLLLSHLEEILYIDEIAYPLSTQLYGESVRPEGYRNMKEFSFIPFPTWTFHVEDIVIQKSLVFMHEEQTVLVRYQILAGDKDLVRLEVKPLTAFRHFQALAYKNERLNKKVDISGGRIHFAGLFFHHNAAIVDPSGSWYCGIQYPEEKGQGLDFEEDLYAPFRLVYTFLKDREMFLSASLEKREVIHPEFLVSREENRRFSLLKNIRVSDPRFQLLAYSGQSFFVRPIGAESVRTTLSTNYPYCEDSARHALIALHGLTLTTGQYETARQTLAHLASQVREGLLPNRWADHKEAAFLSDQDREPDYASIDAPLWLIHAAYEYLRYSEDSKTVAGILFPVLNSILESLINGTRFNIRVASDGLLSGTQRRKALTWMDAKVGNWVVTPREGKPVEVQALWYNALSAMVYMADLFGKSSLKKTYFELALKAKESFNRLFWDPTLGYLFDVVDGEKKDSSLRPNQLLALGLPFPILEEESAKWHSILGMVKQHLLTPYGLRTLAPQDLNYCKSCAGDGFRRNRAYHQGTVWPWLFVPYVRALLRLSDPPARQLKKELLDYMSPLFAHFEDRGMGFISEIFDGDEPHEARGAIAQAMNVGTMLELYEILETENAISEKRDALTLR
ncbi:MAG: glycogen debranching enzyme family protein [Candidatus Omnitrophica bacterium]|nr:glycogen debranching enzyme family protein [Candidatus Omnitrophota bacterium]